MKLSAGVLFFLLYICLTTSAGVQHYSVTKNGRSIQPDGFLVEWLQEEVDSFPGSLPFVLDAMNTPNGLAGYFRYRFTDSCSKVNTNFYPRKKKSGTFLMMDVDTILVEKMEYAVDKTGGSGDTTVVAEWLIPWDILTDDATGTYAVDVLAYTVCGDTMDLLMVSGKWSVKKERIVNNKIILQLITIFLLGLAFYLLKAKAKKRYTK